eukprot:XP_017950387.1 PREDICTED: uncharacterized protein LOC101733460 [Xenopus tropicalis]
MSQQGSVHSFAGESEQVPHEPELTDIQGENPIHTAEQSVRSKRIIKPSQKSRENYEATRDELSSSLSDLWNRTVRCMSVLSYSNNDAADLRDCINRLSSTYERYQRLSAKYTSFLKDTNIVESLAELSKTEALDQERDLLVLSAKEKAELRIAHLQETRSHRSTSSKLTSRSSKTSHSRKSALSDKLIEARANAEAAKVQVSFAKREASLRAEAATETARQQAEAARKKAEMEAELEILQMEKEKASAIARLKVLEQALGGVHDQDCLIPTESEDPVERTSKYVLNQDASNAKEPSLQRPGTTPATHSTGQSLIPVTSNTAVPYSAQPAELQMPAQQQVSHTDIVTQHKILPPTITQVDCSSKLQPAKALETKPLLNAHATSFYPGSSHLYTPESLYNPRVPQVTQAPKSERSDLSDFARYMIRRELINISLSRFDDCPESYRAWKSTFKAAIADLNLTAKEELDLLIKWLGPESADRVKRLRAVHVDYPDAGLAAAWGRLEQTYGSSEAIENALFKRLQNFPKITNKDNRKLQELSDLLMELELAKADPRLSGLSYLDTAHGVNPVVLKLPYGLQEKWATTGSRYKKQYNVSFPPFSYFCKFISDYAWTKNDPSFSFSEPNPPASSFSKHDNAAAKHKELRRTVSVRKTEVPPTTVSYTDKSSSFGKTEDPNRQCPIHKKPHPLKKCRGFRAKSLQERKEILQKCGVCYKCCASSDHFAKDCKAVIKCAECNSDKHVAAMHPTPPPDNLQPPTPASTHGGEEQGHVPASPKISTSCTEVCGEGCSAKCCAKVCLVQVYPEGQPEKAIRIYAILDDQSNRSLARPQFFEIFNIKGDASPYTLNTCAGRIETLGRRANGYVVSSIKGNIHLPLPTLIECDEIPNNREEIPTPEAAYYQPHLRHLANQIPAMDKDADILLLLGRDILRVHKVRQQCNGPHDAPYAQRLDLGWVIVGDVCLDKMHRPSEVDSYKTHVLRSGRTTHFRPCPHHFEVKENTKDMIPATSVTPTSCDDSFGITVFHTTNDDNKIAPSIEDKEFIRIMDNEFFKDNSNSWVAPLPFRTTRTKLPNNREQAISRFASLQRTLKSKPEMKDHFVAFMKKIFENDHAEPAPPLQEHDECWYLPSFGVYHPRKPKQIRVVFDSSAKYQGMSLNDVLLTGPNLTNNLVGVLMRFRREPVAITADIQQMFHCFIVREDHRNFLRFLWHHDNNINSEVIEYRMKVHVFGNSPSPAVATYGLRRTACEGENEYGADAQHFVERDFYVDDGLKSLPTDEEAIDLLKRTQSMLSEANLRLHKIASNSTTVMKAFQTDDHATEFKDLNLGIDNPPIQRSLGLRWDLQGVVSYWDTPLPTDKQTKWESWKQSLKDLEELHIPRCYTSTSLAEGQRREIHIFSDASTEAIAVVAYLKVRDTCGQPHIGFLFGKAKLAPKPEHTIPRLELCGAVLAVEIADFILCELDIHIDAVKFYTDSKVVLGYIYNQTRRFYVYVSNRVERIRKSTKPEQWHYVPSEINPADHATRPVSTAVFAGTSWLMGPEFLLDHSEATTTADVFSLLDPDRDPEIRPKVSALATRAEQRFNLGCQRFERFSTWTRLVRTIARLVHIAHCYHTQSKDAKAFYGWHLCHKSPTAADIAQGERIIIRCVQQHVFSAETRCILKKENISKNSPIANLNPVIDSDGMLRVGGRLNKATIQGNEQNPLIIPGHHHIATLLIRHHHEQVKHQGRHFTEGAIRAAGLWIIGAKRQISNVILKCIQCRKLRGKIQQQQMSELPADRLSTDPPFTHVGLDVFGPWTVMARRTRGGEAYNKRWAVLFTCMSVRAVHIEVIESMDTSSFINALRRFLAIRGPVRLLRSDCGTNFTGACRELQFDTQPVKDYLASNGCTWIFNPPHSSHMGGSWERMIGITRRILDSMLMDLNSTRLTHEILTTFLAEVSAIINSRPLVPVSTDPEFPVILTPATLLTQKMGNAPVPPGDFAAGNLYQSQWKRVQHLANYFWNRWNKEYLTLLQGRRKWQRLTPNLQVGDLILLKDQQAQRIDWPLGLITKIIPSDDGKVRKVEVRVAKDGTTKTFSRPITELILLLPFEH